MNLTQITQQLGAPPEPADGAGVIGLVVLAGIFALAVASPWFKKGSRGPVVAAAILVAIIAAAFTASIAYTVRDGARASREKSVWDA